MKKSAVSILTVLIILSICGAIFYMVSGNYFPSNSELDSPDKQNDKMISMFNAEIAKEIEDHTQSTMHPGYIPEARQHTIDYLKTIRSIESYARHGAKSTQPRNYIELKITFTDGTVAEDIYTGHPCNAYMGPCLVMKVEMQNGKAVKVFTNGQEKKGSPDWVKPDINIMIDKAISYDIDRNHDHYFEPQKTQQDFDKEWENQK